MNKVTSYVARFAWVPYLFFCVGILALFGAEEWLLFSKYSQSQLKDMDNFQFSKSLSRRDVGAMQDDEFTDYISQLYYNSDLAEVLQKPIQEKTEDQPTLEKMDDPKLVFKADEPLIRKEKPHTDSSVEMNNAPKFIDDVKKATVDDLMPLVQAPGTGPANAKFVFHNKIPKAGSTTMKWLLVALSKRNGFTLDHARWCLTGDRCAEHDPVTGQHIDGPDGQEAMLDYIPKKLEEVGDGNYLLLKHHHWFNFTQFGMVEPTYINVARDPVTRYASWYYFERYGWARQEGSRSRFFGGEEDKTRTLDECVEQGHRECLEPVQVLVKYFCGTDMKQCGMMATKGHNWNKVAAATERAKRIIAQKFYVVGVLEHFQATLALFEKMLPEYYAGAPEVSQMPEQEKQRNSSKSSNPGFSNSTRDALERGVLRYEADIYNLIKSLFYQKLKYYNIPLTK